MPAFLPKSPVKWVNFGAIDDVELYLSALNMTTVPLKKIFIR